MGRQRQLPERAAPRGGCLPILTDVLSGESSTAEDEGVATIAVAAATQEDASAPSEGNPHALADERHHQIKRPGEIQLSSLYGNPT